MSRGFNCCARPWPNFSAVSGTPEILRRNKLPNSNLCTPCRTRRILGGQSCASDFFTWTLTTLSSAFACLVAFQPALHLWLVFFRHEFQRLFLALHSIWKAACFGGSRG